MNKELTKARQKEKSAGKTTDIPVKSKKKMTDKLFKLEQDIMIPPKCSVTKTSLVIDKSITEEEFVNIGNALGMMKEALMFWLGDWILFYRDNPSFVGDVPHSVERACYKVRFMYSDRTVKNAVWVCKHVEPSRRREKLKFGHHQVVAPLPPDEQDKWLKAAEWNGFTVKELRNEIMGKKLKLLAKENEDYSVPVAYQGNKYFFMEFLKSCTRDINKLTNRLRAISKIIAYASFSHLLSYENLEKNEVKMEFVKSCYTLFYTLEWFVQPFEKEFKSLEEGILHRAYSIMKDSSRKKGSRKGGRI